MIKLSEIAKLLNISCEKDVLLTGVSIDSRKIEPNNLFVAIRGERFDGHDFIHEAVANGAAAVLCSKPIVNIEVMQLVVKDPVEAIALLATEYRSKLNCKVIALTGSNGKTTVKEMIASILPKPSFATPGNLNNHIGVPLSVFQLKANHNFAVFELGANHKGEIAHTVAIVKPDVTLINNIAPAHIGEFGSIDNVASAKGEIHQGLGDHGIAVINDDDAYAHHWDKYLANKKVLHFSASHKADVYAKNITFNANGCGEFTLVMPAGEVNIKLQVAGIHNVSNAVAAATCTYALGISLAEIANGLQQFSGVPGRMTFLLGKNNAVVIDDTYNANLRSSLSAIDVLSNRAGRRIFVFGDMGELGNWSEEHHQNVGIAAREQGIDVLLTCGLLSESTSRAFGSHAKHYLRQEDLVADLLKQLDKNTTVLVKGSRSSKMEKIVHQLVG